MRAARGSDFRHRSSELEHIPGARGAVEGGVGLEARAGSLREIGVRLALGARPADIAWLLFREGARMTLIGVAIGFPLAVALGRLLSAGFFEVSPFGRHTDHYRDPETAKRRFKSPRLD